MGHLSAVPPLPCAFGGNLQRIREGKVSVSGWVPVLQFPLVALTSVPVVLGATLPASRNQKGSAVFREFNKSQNPWQVPIQRARHVPRSWHAASDVSLGRRSSEVSVSSAFPVTLLWMHLGLAALRAWGSQRPKWLPMTFVRILCHPGVSGASDSNF